MKKLIPAFLLLSSLGLAATASATVYDATNANSDPMWHGGGSNHSLWLPGLLAAGADWQIDPNNPAGTFDYNEGTGEAVFHGTVNNENDPASSGAFRFFFAESKGNPKKELNADAYAPGPGGVDTDTWTYFDFDTTKDSVMVGQTGAIAGLEFLFTQKDTGDTGYKGQLGIGANGKNINLGFSAWLMWALVESDPMPSLTSSTTSCPASLESCSGHGDINIDLAAVPVPAAVWLFGTALIGFIGFSRRTTV